MKYYEEQEEKRIQQFNYDYMNQRIKRNGKKIQFDQNE